MPRALVTSANSYATFKVWALPVLQEVVANNPAADIEDKANALYNRCYTRSQHPALPDKVALRNQDLLWAMLGVADGTGNHRVHIQGGDDMNVAGCAMEYRRLLDGPGVMLSNQAQQAMTSYLHIYPTDGRDEDNNWRIAANVKPVDVPEVTRRIAGIEDAHANAGHFKVTPPGSVGKPDSMILYMTKDGQYDATRDDVRRALNGLDIQETFAPMWDELAPGVAVGAEPPKIEDPNNAGRTRGISFGAFRCVLTTMAFDYAVHNDAADVAANLTAIDFGAAMDSYFDRYGVPHGTPHDQLQLVIGNAPQVPAVRTAYITQQQWDDYLEAYADYKGYDDDHYDGWLVSNRAAIV